MIDYRKMLIAYLDWVLHDEGIDFLGDGPAAHLPSLTDEEAIELAKLRDINRHPSHAFYNPDGSSK